MKIRAALLLLISTAIWSFVGISAVLAADGSGTNMVVPTSVTAGASGTTLTFTFTAAETMDSGGIAITVPSEWTPPQGATGTAGHTTAASTAGVTANIEDALNSATGWAGGTACNLALAISTITIHEGTGSLLCSILFGAVGERWHKNIAPEDWSGYTKVAFWLNPTLALGADQLRFAYDDSANLASPLEQLSIGALPANTWTYVVLSFGPTTRTAVTSFGFVLNTTILFANIFADDILIGPGAPAFPGGGEINVRLLQLASGQTLSVTYGAGGGASGAVAPTTAGSYTFGTRSRVSDSGTLTAITASLQVAVAEAPPPGGEPSGIIPGGNIPPPVSTLKFAGRAYPDARLTAVIRELGPNQTPVKQAAVVTTDGSFGIEFEGVLQGGLATYGLVIADKDGRISQTKLFNLGVLKGGTELREIFAAPTLDFSGPAAVTRGGFISFIGYATPGSNIEVEVDGEALETSPKAENDGRFKALFNTAALEFGVHRVRARQRDAAGTKSDFSAQKTFVVSRLTVPKADFNGDDIINISDWSVFLSRWHTEDPDERATLDLDGDGAVTIADFSIFVRTIRR